MRSLIVVLDVSLSRRWIYSLSICLLHLCGSQNAVCSVYVLEVAKKTGTYDDPAVEIQEMTAVIKQDITALNSAVVDLQLLCNSQNESGGLSGDTTSHSTTVVDSLKNRLMSTTKEFKEVLTLRTEVGQPLARLRVLSIRAAMTFFSVCGLLLQKLKVHDNRKQLFSRKDASNPFARQRPLAPPPWANGPSSSSSESCLR